MVLKRCKSGLHQWDHIAQTQQLQKCCNGYVLVMVGVRDENNPYLENGNAVRVGKLIPEGETERIKRLRANEAGAVQKDAKGFLIVN